VEEMRIRGMDTVLRNLNKEITAIEGRTLKGLIRAVILIRRQMEMVPPLTPVEFGNLRSSFFVVTTKGAHEGSDAAFVGKGAATMHGDHISTMAEAGQELDRSQGPSVAFGFSANYAVYVHENVGANFQRPGAGAKFLEAAIRTLVPQILQVIREEARIR
jgi:hypothetical protein